MTQQDIRIAVCACVVLLSCCHSNALLFGSSFGLRHPMYEQRLQQAEDMLLLSALFGIDINDRVLWDVLTGSNRGGPRRGLMGPGMGRQDPMASALQTLGIMDGPDGPDAAARPAGPGGPNARPKPAGAGGAGQEREGGPGGEEAGPVKKGAGQKKPGAGKGKGAAPKKG